MTEKVVAVAALMAIMLAPETICNVLHVGELPPEQSAPVAIVESVEAATPINATVRPAVEEPITNPSPLSGEEWDTLVDVCEENGIDTSLALGLIWVESRFQPEAVSPSGCYGYCQLNPRYFPDGLTPTENIRAGMEYLGDCLTWYDGDIPAALTAYHDGHDTGRRGYAEAVLEAAKEGAWTHG